MPSLAQIGESKTCWAWVSAAPVTILARTVLPEVVAVAESYTIQVPPTPETWRDAKEQGKAATTAEEVLRPPEVDLFIY
jgi:hypothetical protein